MTTATDIACPGCRSSGVEVFWETARAPVFCNVLWPSRDEAMQAPQAPISLGLCRTCGLIHNTAFNPNLLEYSGEYENALHFSPHFRRYAEDLARMLIDTYDLHSKDVVEIGCGEGHFLQLLCSIGGNRGKGFDPGYTPAKSGQSLPPEVSIVPEPFTAETTDQPADFICCRHVLEHIASPLEFLWRIGGALASRTGSVLYFEVPNVLYTLDARGMWDIIYEHCSYFTPASLANLFIGAGFAPIRVSEAYGGQFAAIEARPDGRQVAPGGNPLREVDLDGPTAAFRAAYDQKLSLWRNALSGFRAAGDRVVLWGAGSKGVTFLNALDVHHVHIPYVIDLNPRKHGRYIAGTGQQVMPPGVLRDYRPDAIVVMNGLYREEIARMLDQMHVTSRIMVA